MAVRSGTGGAHLSLPWTRRAPYTMSLWAKYEGFFNGEGNLFSTDNGLGAGTAWSQYVFVTPGVMTWFADGVGGQVDTTAPTTASAATSRWFWTGMRVLASTGATSDIELIIWDPATRKFTTGALPNAGNAVDHMWLCSDGYGENGDYSIRYFKLWDGVLSRKDLIREMQQGRPVSHAQLHSYLPLSTAQTTGPEAFNLDKSGHGNDWTLSGTFTTRNVPGQMNNPPIPDRINPLFRDRAYMLARTPANITYDVSVSDTSAVSDTGIRGAEFGRLIGAGSQTRTF